MGMTFNNPIPTATYKILIDYAGNGFNAANSTAVYETAVIPPSDMLNSNMVVIQCCVGSTSVSTDGSTTHVPTLAVATREQGGAYSTDATFSLVGSCTPGGSHDIYTQVSHTVSVCHTLTAAEKLNGLQIKFTGIADAQASVSNIKTLAFSLS